VVPAGRQGLSETTMDAYRHVVVTVPGVGEAQPGDSLRALAATLPGPPGSYHRSDLVLGHDLYPRLVNSAPALPDLIEVDWSDLRRAPGSWLALLHQVCRLVTGLPLVQFEWCDAAPSVRVQPAYRDVVACTCLWTLWPVLLTLVHAVAVPLGRGQAALLESVVLTALVLLARSQWRRDNRATPAGYAWLAIGLALTGVLWLAPRWTGLATTLSIRVYGLGWLVGALVFVAMAVEVTLRALRDQVSWRRGLAGLTLAALPLALTSALTACLWSLVLNVCLACGSAPVLDALKGWQQTFAAGLGFHLASAEWAMACATAIAGALGLGAALHVAVTRRGAVARGWVAVGLVVVPLLFVLVALCLLLTSRYLHAPLAAKVSSIGAGAGPTAIYTWSLFRLLPLILLLVTPARRLPEVLADACFYVMSPEAGGPSTRRAGQERLAQLLEFLDRGRYDRIHVVAHGQGSAIALDVLQSTTPRHPLVLTTLGSPAGTLYRDLLDWPLDPAALAATEWCNLYHVDDPLGGPIGVEDIDAPLAPGGHTGYWLETPLADRIVAVMRTPLPAAQE